MGAFRDRTPPRLRNAPPAFANNRRCRFGRTRHSADRAARLWGREVVSPSVRHHDPFGKLNMTSDEVVWTYALAPDVTVQEGLDGALLRTVTSQIRLEPAELDLIRRLAGEGC